jgi:hypothetical protein
MAKKSGDPNPQRDSERVNPAQRAPGAADDDIRGIASDEDDEFDDDDEDEELDESDEDEEAGR